MTLITQKFKIYKNYLVKSRKKSVISLASTGDLFLNGIKDVQMKSNPPSNP